MSETKRRCPRCKKRRRFRGHRLSDRYHGPAWHLADDGILVCYICHPYTSCGSPAGIQSVILVIACLSAAWKLRRGPGL